MWLAAAVGAVLVAIVGLARGAVAPRELPEGVAWDILAFLFFVFLTAMGLRNVGLVDALSRAYGAGGESTYARIFVVGTMSSLGSAVLNNHPMAALNSLALQSMHGDARWPTLAALVGGDLGPRLLPMGSLAGLLWIATARRVGLEISTRAFVRAGLLCTLPALAASLAVLCLEAYFFG